MRNRWIVWGLLCFGLHIAAADALTKRLKKALTLGNVQKAEQVIIAGADPNDVFCEYVGDAIDIAAQMNNPKKRALMTELLLDHGFDLTTKTFTYTENEYRAWIQQMKALDDVRAFSTGRLEMALLMCPSLQEVKQILGVEADPNLVRAEIIDDLIHTAKRWDCKSSALVIEQLLDHGLELQPKHGSKAAMRAWIARTTLTD